MADSYSLDYQPITNHLNYQHETAHILSVNFRWFYFIFGSFVSFSIYFMKLCKEAIGNNVIAMFLKKSVSNNSAKFEEKYQES